MPNLTAGSPPLQQRVEKFIDSIGQKNAQPVTVPTLCQISVPRPDFQCMDPIEQLELDTPPDVTEALEHAFTRAADFMAVQRSGGDSVSLDAVARLQDSVGLSEAARVVFRERLTEINVDADRGQVFFGVILGLMAAAEVREREGSVR